MVINGHKMMNGGSIEVERIEEGFTPQLSVEKNTN